MINRSVVIIKAKEPFIDWLRMLPDASDGDVKDLKQDHTAYLIPEYDNDAEREGIMRNYYVEIFDQELWAWSRDEDAWPKNRSYKTFKQWFDLEFASCIYDTDEDTPLKDE